jgi:signal transduction histidine kinase
MDRQIAFSPSLAVLMREWLRPADGRESLREHNLRSEEQSRERTRIARELHDTLLQGLLSASMQLHLADARLSADSPAKPILNRVIDLLAKGIVESRNVLQGLRSSNLITTSLEEAFRDLGNECVAGDAVRFRIVVLGQPTELDPNIHEQIYRIAREALLNAVRHANATSIEAELEYLPHKLRVVVRDNGSGIDPQALDSAKDSHWGLLGMRERAATINAKLRLRTSPAAGTELEISVPIPTKPARPISTTPQA